MKKTRMHMVWRFIGLALGILMLISLPACAWIDEFDSRYDTKIEAKTTELVRIAWINSYSDTTLWSTRLQTGMLETLARHGYSRPLGTLEWQAFHMNAKGDESFTLLQYRAEAMIPEVIDFDPSIIIISDDEAALTLAPIYPDRDVPIVYCGVTTDLHVTGLDQLNITGVTEPIFAEETLAIARAMVPVRHQNLVIADDSMTGKASTNSILAQLAGAEDSEQIPAIKMVRDWEEWKSVIQAYTDDVDIVFIASYHPLLDRTGEFVSEQEMMRWTQSNSSVPVFAFTQSAVSNGAVAGLVTDAYNQGHYAAEIAAYVADGGDITMAVSNLSIEQTNRLVLNLAAAKRWSLNVPVMLPITAEVYEDTQQLGGGQ